MTKDIYDRTVAYIVENQDKFYRLAYSYVRDKDSALDVVQNSVIKALENCYNLKNEKAISTWMYRIVVNEALQYIRKNKREISMEPGEMPEKIYHEEAYDKDREIYERVQALGEPGRTVIFLHFYEDMTLQQIAQITKTNVNTVKSRLYAALKKLQKGWKEETA